jgi:hypothetical protein
MTAVDNITTLMNVNDGIVNKGYRPLTQEDISGDEAQ